MKKFLIIIAVIALAIIAGIFIYQNQKENEDYDLEIYFFNAGKADSILISSNGKYILIDTGEEELGSTILSYLKNHNITKLDYLIITHFDKDHVGSASSIIDNIEIDHVYQSNSPKESEYYTNYITSLEEAGIEAETISGDVDFELGDLKVTVNGPTQIFESNESNNSSLIVSINYKNTNYLFMGDSQNDRIKDYLKNHDAFEYDFMKIPYHGNYQKQLDNLLEWATPQYGVITCSDEEPDTTDTEALLNEMNIEYYLTKNGPITITSDGTNIKIEQN